MFATGGDASCIVAAPASRKAPARKSTGPSFSGAPPGAATEPLRPPGPKHPETGNPCSPPGVVVPLHILKENTMFAVHATRETRAVGVLLGGSGRARVSTQRMPRLAALLKPCPSASTQASWASETRVGGGQPC